MPEAIVEQPALDARVSGLPPESEPAPPLRLTLAEPDESDELKFMRATVRFYVQKHGFEVVRQAVEDAR